MRLRILLALLAAVVMHAEEGQTALVQLVGAGLDGRWKAYCAENSALKRRLYLVGYEEHGLHGPWDAAVRAALGALCGDYPDPMTFTRQSNAAKAAGCTDPLMRYRMMVGWQNAASGDRIVQHGTDQGTPLGQERKTGELQAVEYLELADAMSVAGYSPLVVQAAVSRCLSLCLDGDLDDPALVRRLAATAAKAAAAAIAEAGDDPVAIRDVFFERRLVLGVGNHWCRRATDLDRQLLERIEPALVNADPWWQDAVIGGYHAAIAILARSDRTEFAAVDAVAEEAIARTRLERAAQQHPDRAYPAFALMRLAGSQQPAEQRRWFEAAVRADPLMQQIHGEYIAVLSRGPDPVEALIRLAVEASEINRPPWQSCIMNAFVKLTALSTDTAALWRDPRIWPMLDRFTGSQPRLQSERLVWAWRCGQKAEAVRLWRANPQPRVPPPVLLMVGATVDEVVRECSDWASAQPVVEPVMPDPSAKKADF